MKIIEIDGELDPDVIELLKVSGKLRSRDQIMRKLVLDAIDPAIPMGREFEFEPRPHNDPMYLSLEVPDSGAQVDLAHAWTIAQLDAQASARILDRDDSLAATVRVYINQLRWLAFWAWRFPNEVWRQKFETQLMERQAGLNELRLKAQLTFRFDVLDKLKSV